jgi:hypothetical protein
VRYVAQCAVKVNGVGGGFVSKFHHEYIIGQKRPYVKGHWAGLKSGIMVYSYYIVNNCHEEKPSENGSSERDPTS